MKKFWIFLVLCVIASVFYFGLRAGPDSPNKNTENSAMGHQTKSASVDSFNSVAVERRPSEDEAPKKYQFPNVHVSKDFGNDEELRGSFPGSDRLVMDEFYKNFRQNAIAFNSREQYEWLMKSGYPMPEEVVTGYKMSIDDLGKLVDQGNVKASYFYLMREVYSKDSGEILDKMNKSGDGSEWSRRIVAAQNAVMASGSAFTGYILAAKAGRDGGSPEGVYAGYALAAVMGDSRALNVVAEAPRLDIRAFVSILASNIDMLRISNPNVFTGRPSEFPDRYSTGVSYSN
jgi:hypothetical protein